MSKRTASACAAVLVCALVTGCAAPSSFLGYLENRRQDLIDVAHVDIGMIHVGAVAYALPFMVGVEFATGFDRESASTNLQIGLGGPRLLEKNGIAGGLLLPATRWDEDKEDGKSNKIFGQRPKRTPSGFSVGAMAGVLLGVGAEVDVLEVIDFVFGLICLDFMADDEYVIKDEEPKEDGTPDPLPLPDTGGTTKPPEPPKLKAIVVNINPGGVLVVDGRILSFEDLVRKLADAVKEDPNQTIRLRGNINEHPEQIANVLGACAEAKVKVGHIDIVAEKPEPPAPEATE